MVNIFLSRSATRSDMQQCTHLHATLHSGLGYFEKLAVNN